MQQPYPDIAPYFCYIFLGLLCCIPGAAQHPNGDSSYRAENSLFVINDSIPVAGDTIKKALTTFFGLKKQQAIQSFKSRAPSLPALRANTLTGKNDSVNFSHPFGNLFKSTPLLRFTGGYASYQVNYRSGVDTPYVESNIVQHNLNGRLHFTLANKFPLQVTFWGRKSNSNFFKDIADVQVSFNAAAFTNSLHTALQSRILALSYGLRDSLTEKLYALKNRRLSEVKNILQQSFSPQSLAEAHEIIKVKGITYKPNLPDSINIQREDSLRKAAAFFLEWYNNTQLEYNRLNRQVDSLRQRYRHNLDKINQLKQMMEGRKNDYTSPRRWKNKLNEYGLQDVQVPAKYRWLMGLRNFSVGRSTANYSELTAKNISVNGINIEYNSWYYLAVMAGTVNYRSRDFVVTGFNKKPQTLYMLRAGIGRLTKNYFIASAYRGQKQLFGGRAGQTPVITITGISAETRWQLNRTTWLLAEAAKSMAPDFRNNPAEAPTKLTFSDKTNEAFAVRLYSYIPVTRTRVEGFYKHTGANFQSFSSFQTNAALESWYVKAEQHFFKRQLRIAASLRKNEFTNPFIVQDYKSNTVFKSITASLRIRKWPVIVIGYQPMSQLTVLDNQVVENRFQSLTGNLYHRFNIKDMLTASTLLVNRFYNSSADTGFLYYNATNIYWMQHLFFNRFTANVGVSHTSNPGYRLNVLDAGIQPAIGEAGTIGFGLKVNNLNNDITKVGGYVNAGMRLFKLDMLFISYDYGYLPGRFTGAVNNATLVRNDMATVQFVKRWK